MFEATALAKINLALHVTGQRENGFHDLESLVVFADLGDELTARPAQGDVLRLSGPFAGALTHGQTNLVSKAVEAFRARWPGAVPHGIAISLAKNLPVSAGIGGGSADAAATLRLMAGLADPPVGLDNLMPVAARLGADVPVCLYSQSCLVRGIGEIVEPVDILPPCHLVLVNPLVPVSTSEVFRRLKSRANPGLPAIAEPFSHAAMLGLWMAETRNDLEQAAIEAVPVIGDLISDLARTSGCVSARMSGSGATVFGLFGSEKLAHQAAQDMRGRFPDAWVAAAPLVVG
ncbi:MAG: 4-(cytidine 5'-diphospho)-2-C-methyl-D-erythritol kinase [Alphaproteobacteria bacterium]|nr:4-(cytidine 5'-diphospho)-2-C-methyl-D-erythritol kinase [Alphaproteobacteria bacterium]